MACLRMPKTRMRSYKQPSSLLERLLLQYHCSRVGWKAAGLGEGEDEAGVKVSFGSG